MKTPVRIERWWWLGVCLVVSLLIHFLIGWNSRTLFGDFGPSPTPGIEVALQPLPAEKKPKPTPKTPEPKPKKKAEQKPTRKPTQIAKAPRPVKSPVHHAPVPKPVRMAKLPEQRPPTKQIVQGGLDPLKQQKPVPLAPITPTPLKHTQTTQTSTTPKTTQTHTATAETLPNQTQPVKTASAFSPTMRFHNVTLPMDNPLTSPGTTTEKVTLPAAQPNAMRVTRITKNFSLAGGGLAAPSAVLGGHGGARGPEAPPEDIMFSGGGAGGMKLPKAAPRMGGGGGNPLLTVSNPLSAFAIPEDKPGLGAGLGGGAGTGAKGGVGIGQGHGIGLGVNGKMMASLHRAPGSGIGAGRGSSMGTRAPGGGRGTGSELPGTGGLGGGLGHGLGSGIGSGFRPGLGAAGGAARQGSGGGGVQIASGGVPFGDISGLLNGDRNGGGGIGGGPGGSGRGTGAGGRGGASGPRRFVYLLDVSGSMAKHDKIVKAREALKKALSELAPGELFNIICFDADRYPFADKMQRVTPANIQRASEYIDNIKLDQNPGTNFSGVLATALSLSNVSRIFLMSDGDPDNQHETEPDKIGILDWEQLRASVREHNTHKTPVDTFALGVGHHFKGMDLMRAIAEDNGGVFRSVNLRDNPVVEDTQK